MNTRRLIRKTCSLWDEWTQCRIAQISKFYSYNKHGLDLKKSGFVKSEVMKADECIYIEKNQEIVGFVFLITKKRPRALYVTLMASFEKGIGTKLMQFLNSTLLYPHEYIGLRATCKSVGFYIKCGFQVFDFISMEEYVDGRSDPVITDAIFKNLQNISKLEELQSLLIDRDWMPDKSDEFPLLKKRNTPVFEVRRQSNRINF
tara:strand:- start:73 stop:681 length:609 start_codon:yes stop_codon:yes gene_type:complete